MTTADGVDDGTLALDAPLALAGDLTCSTADAGARVEAVPCDELERRGGVQILDCALLHLVTREEVRRHIASLKRTRRVACDDATPLDRLRVE